jgi:hypothetical protein
MKLFFHFIDFKIKYDFIYQKGVFENKLCANKTELIKVIKPKILTVRRLLISLREVDVVF